MASSSISTARSPGVLLRFVEAMDLVDEQHGLGGLALARFRNDLPQVRNAGAHGGNPDEGRVGMRGDDPGERSLTDARRAPEDQRGQLARLKQAS
jgi:hypothetical protein